ncbi:hypothetical protein [Metabacillus litoralis]|uniref:hypothetical protein n=1 Tax=Metabacillus litoralis TaxID=152268 RepID=UPI001CFCB65F|nr:hypothetical protein [Metabacillus litoralis]
MTRKKREMLLATLVKRNPYISKTVLSKEVVEENEASHSKPLPRSLKLKDNPVNSKKQSGHQTNQNQTKKVPIENKDKVASNKSTEKRPNLLKEAIQEHEAGIKGNKQSVKKAHSLLKELYEQDPDSKEIKAYFGSAISLLARDAHSVTDKMKFALEGLKHLDEVAELDPKFIVGRFLRGHVAYRLPDLYFQRSATAIEDFSYMVEAYEQDSTILKDEEYVEILKNLVDVYRRTNQPDSANNYQEKLKAFKEMKNPAMVDNDLASENNSESSTSLKDGMTKEAFTFYNKALNGTVDEVKEALNFFEVFVLTNTSPEVEMYYIDLQSMVGRDSINTYEMFGAAIKAMKAMDSLINEHPNSCELKLIRAKQSLRIPELFFRRAAIAVSDIEYVLKNHTFINEKGSDIHHQLLFDLGIAYEKLDMLKEAEEAWNKLKKLNPNRELQAKLKEKKEIYSYKKIDVRTLSVATKDKLYEKAKEMHEIAAKGCKIAAEQSLEAWGKAKDAFSECEIAQTYYAASVALMGKFANDPQEMFKDTIQGIKLLNVSIQTDHPELKYLRGVIYQSLPEGFFHTSDKAIKDFKSVKSAYEQNRENPPISKQQYLKLLFDLGHLYKKTNFKDQAEKTWQALYKEDSNSEYIHRLKGLGMAFE